MPVKNREPERDKYDLLVDDRLDDHEESDSESDEPASEHSSFSTETETESGEYELVDDSDVEERESEDEEESDSEPPHPKRERFGDSDDESETDSEALLTSDADDESSDREPYIPMQSRQRFIRYELFDDDVVHNVEDPIRQVNGVRNENREEEEERHRVLEGAFIEEENYVGMEPLRDYSAFGIETNPQSGNSEFWSRPSSFWNNASRVPFPTVEPIPDVEIPDPTFMTQTEYNNLMQYLLNINNWIAYINVLNDESFDRFRNT
ncbi:unnamed protein product [Caenorhabditis angaria]|uniref:Uncharacterized protein n=1 Tax=Caenorhabditis angaria TaxID=860376 RepID=A0A9P1J3J9_9PELO|nr:unnamed protein product [Caenorhabditis angaria]